MSERIWTAALVVIGDEILSGRTQDKNVAQVAAWLNVQGIRLAEVRVVPDVEEAIVEAVNALRARNDYLFTTGGIGPTHDDITVDAIAAALGVGVVHHPQAVAVLERYYASRGGATEARLRMARVPEGADLIPNRMSGAPGIRIGNIFIMAGVPHITAGMLDALTGTLEGGQPVISRTIGCWVPESEVADVLRETERAHEGVAIGSYPFFRDGRVGRELRRAQPRRGAGRGDDRRPDRAIGGGGPRGGRGRDLTAPAAVARVGAERRDAMRTALAMVAFAAMLAGCGGKTADESDNSGVVRGNATGPLPTAAATNSVAAMEAKIAALTEPQRKLAFYRAIYDADYQCGEIVKVDVKPRDDNRPVWLATCDDNGEYVITLQPGGIFTVSGVQQPKRRMPKGTVIMPVGTK